MKVYLKNSVGVTKQVKLGFSWTMLFFGFFVPLFRGDLKWTLISLVLSFVTCGFAWFVLPFIYNKAYIKELLYAGWVPADDMSINAMLEKGLPVPQN